MPGLTNVMLIQAHSPDDTNRSAHYAATALQTVAWGAVVPHWFIGACDVIFLIAERWLRERVPRTGR